MTTPWTPSARSGTEPLGGFLTGLLNTINRMIPEPRYDREADLVRDLELLCRLFDVPSIDRLSFKDGRSVERYYTDTEAQYTVVHSPAGAVHFGLDHGGVFQADGLYGQARLVESLLREHGVRDVLETGSGKGFNSIYLAGRNPDVRFRGIDWTPLHVQISTERGRDLSNLRFEQGDFCALPMADASFDLVFSIEASCYADTPDKLARMLASVRRVLRPGGRFVVVDFYRADDLAQRSPVLKRAVELIEGAWVIDALHPLSAFEAAAEHAGFHVEQRDDLRIPAMPSVRRLHRGARLSFHLWPLLKPLFGSPSHNPVAVLALPYAFVMGALEYRYHVLTLPNRTRSIS